MSLIVTNSYMMVRSFREESGETLSTTSHSHICNSCLLKKKKLHVPNCFTINVIGPNKEMMIPRAGHGTR